MKWIDITLTMEEGLPCWPGDRPFSHDITARRGVDGCRYNLSVVSMSVHFGTHLDAPYHYFNHGRQIQDLDLNLLIGPCQLVELAGGAGSSPNKIWRRRFGLVRPGF